MCNFEAPQVQAFFMNYYEILGVDINANEESIKRAFRYRAKLLHPDVSRHSRSVEEFQLINEAYQILSNAEKRRLYDIRLSQGQAIQSRRVYYRPGAASNGYAKQHYYAYKKKQETYQPTRFEKIFDQFLFFFMLMAGLSAVFYGIYRAVGEPVEGVNPYLGIVFGVGFTTLFIYVWDKKQRMDH
ncbi:MAG: J domain-containing protein [Bacteroidia bacterium]|nr:MAG: J domain-containing protein [Bacteroidia bacterium]